MKNTPANHFESPFGRPQASHLTEDEIRKGYFSLPNTTFDVDTGSMAFTSRRGGGKTHVIRKSYLDLKRAMPGSIVEYESTAYSTEYALDDLKQYSGNDLQNHLRIVWEIVLALRVAGLYLDAITRGHGSMTKAERRNFRHQLNSLIQSANVQPDPNMDTAAIYSQILPKLQKKHMVQQYLESFNRRNLVAFLGRAVRTTIYLFLDDTDEEYHHSPSFWNSNLASLFETISYLRSALPHVHIVTAVRREVCDFLVNANPNATRIAAMDNVKDIVWTRDTLRMFFENKIRRLPPETRLFRGENTGLLKSFLGTNTMLNNTVGVEETTFDYLLRHTQYRARDLVNMGNDIWLEFQTWLATKQNRFSEDNIRDCIRAGVEVGSGQIAKEIVSDCNSAIYDLAGRNVGPNVADRLLRALGSNVVTKEVLEDERRNLAATTPELAKVDPYDQLAYWGLLGWIKQLGRGRFVQKFNIESRRMEARINELPDSELYFVHPVIYDLPGFRESIHIDSRFIVGHDYPLDKKFLRSGATTTPSDTELRGPYRLHWTERQIFDVYGSVFTLSAREHALLKALFDTADGVDCVPYEDLYSAILASEVGYRGGKIRLRSTAEQNAARHDVQQAVRAFRARAARRGVPRRSLIENKANIGYRRGGGWHATKPLLDRQHGYVHLFRDSPDQPDPASTEDGTSDPH